MQEPTTTDDKILVAIKLDLSFDDKNAEPSAEIAALLKEAKNLSRRMRASLRLISVCEPNNLETITGTPWRPMFHWQETWLASALQEQKKEDLAKAKTALERLATQFALGSSTEIHVVSAAHASSAIIADAVAHTASLILLSAGIKSEDFFVRGYSTPLHVMAESPIPVLVINQRSDIHLSRSRLRLLFADDLRESTAIAVQKTIDWATRLGSCDVCQLHVEELNETELSKVLRKAAPELQSNGGADKLTSNLLNAIDGASQNRLSSRTGHADEQLKTSNGTFQRKILRGSSVRHTICAEAEAFDADLIVFGRHHTLHRRPFAIGRVAYHAMLSQRRAVMVMP